MNNISFDTFVQNSENYTNLKTWSGGDYLGHFKKRETGSDGTQILLFENENFPIGQQKLTVGRNNDKNKIELYGMSFSVEQKKLTYGIINDNMKDEFSFNERSHAGSAVRKRKKTRKTNKKTKRRKRIDRACRP